MLWFQYWTQEGNWSPVRLPPIQQPLPPMGKSQGKATSSLIDCFYNSCSTTTTAHGCVCFLHVLVHSWLYIACFRGKRHIWFDFNHLQPSKFLTRCTCETLGYLASAVNGTKSEGFFEDIDGSFCLNGFMSESSSVTYEARLLSQCVW